MRFLLLFSATLLLAAMSGGLTRPAAQQNPSIQAAREQAYRANNIGVALLEQFKYREGAGQFQRALKIQPSFALARVNLAIALYNAPDLEGASREIKAASLLLPSSPQVHYLAGLIARSRNRIPEAIAEFQQVLKIDPRDPGANINLGQMLTVQRRYSEAITALRNALSSEPYSVTATYNLAIALARSGSAPEGQTMMKKFQDLRDKPYGITLGRSYLEQGRYAEALSSSGAEAELVDAAVPDVTFSGGTSSLFTKPTDTEPREFGPTPIGKTFNAGDLNEQAKRQIVHALAGAAAPFDFDGDGDV
ncbi:MAG: tetratricopeptide repeat protein, partial [Acidobacteriota bacterium]